MFARLLFMWKNADTRATKVLHTCDRPLFSRYWRSTEQVQSFIFSFSLACLLALASGALVEEGLVALCAHCVLVVCGAPFSFFPSPLFFRFIPRPLCAPLASAAVCCAAAHTHTHTHRRGVSFSLLFPPSPPPPPPLPSLRESKERASGRAGPSLFPSDHEKAVESRDFNARQWQVSPAYYQNTFSSRLIVVVVVVDKKRSLHISLIKLCMFLYFGLTLSVQLLQSKQSFLSL